LLSVLGHLLTSPKDVGGIGVFTQTPGSAPAATFVKVGSAFARDRSYPVSSVELYQPVSSSTRSPAGFEMSFETSSLTLLDLVLREGTPGRGIPALTLVVRSSGRNARLITTETLYKAVVASFDENLSGSVAGEVVLSTR
jgi:hypothetical protein